MRKLWRWIQRCLWRLLLWLALQIRPARPRRKAPRQAIRVGPASAPIRRNARKPSWIADQIVQLKALDPALSCRQIQEIFNRRYSGLGLSVGLTYTAGAIKDYRLEILRLRTELKHRIPRPQPRNRSWALDLTGVPLDGRQRIVLGILDHGSRACLRLVALPDKSSLSILRALLQTVRRYGCPQSLRVDNEACLISRVMRLALALLGIRLQRIEPRCPWQNGRIERFFGTLKPLLLPALASGVKDLPQALKDFRTWYNHVRPHQHLYGYTPAEAWEGRPKATGEPLRFSAAEEWLAGWYFPP